MVVVNGGSEADGGDIRRDFWRRQGRGDENPAGMSRARKEGRYQNLILGAKHLGMLGRR